MLEEEELDEFSGTGAVAGFSLPLGMSPTSPRRKKKSKLKESKKSSGLSGEAVGAEDFTFNNHIRYSVCEDGYNASEHFEYYDSIDVLSRSFGLSNNPFGKNRESGIKRAMKYLQGEIKYPHEA